MTLDPLVRAVRSSSPHLGARLRECIDISRCLETHHCDVSPLTMIASRSGSLTAATDDNRSIVRSLRARWIGFAAGDGPGSTSDTHERQGLKSAEIAWYAGGGSTRRLALVRFEVGRA